MTIKEATLNLTDYQSKASTFALSVSPLERVFGLLEEAGEVAGAFKRMERGDYDMPTFGAKLAGELGDVLWYLAQICSDNQWSLEDIAQSNLDKLESRKARSMILGSGSNR